ncbi:MAG: UDP-2,3-diacylglucosamine diphosphatase LpxI, partial [Thermodesulfobacteriota bacterium]
MTTNKIGIIAGGGQFPLLFAEAAKKQGRQVVAAAHKGETSPEIDQAADRVCWVKLGQLGRIISFFKDEGVTETVFAGAITKTRIFKDVWPDLKGLSLWNKIDIRQDDAILRAVAAVLEEEGIRVLPSTLYLPHLLFPRGVLTKKRPSAEQVEDIRFGWQTARAIGALDIGQCVVVRDRSVLAVEAIEGTDAAIRRGGELGREGAVVVKLKKPQQDFRFDLPAIGLKTIETMQGVQARVLAVEAGQALLFDCDEVVRQANRAGIVVVGVEEEANGSLSL